jgi:hypothetical protein
MQYAGKPSIVYDFMTPSLRLGGLPGANLVIALALPQDHCLIPEYKCL